MGCCSSVPDEPFLALHGNSTAASDARIPKEALELWASRRGQVIEPLLVSGAVALLDARWLVQLAATPGSIICRRQELPPAAFVSVDDLKAACVSTDDSLRVIALSYAWLNPIHPDPNGYTLRRLAHVLKAYLDMDRAFEIAMIWGVFWECVDAHSNHSCARTC